MAQSSWPTGTVDERVRAALAEIRPAIQMDGGDVELLQVADSKVYVRLRGACRGCPMASSTLADLVAERIKLYAPEIEDVIAG